MPEKHHQQQLQHFTSPSTDQKEGLLNQNVAATDAAPVTVYGVQDYIRNVSTEETIVYHAMKDKMMESLEKLAFFASYTSILVHDHETVLHHFGTGHRKCNIHLPRSLKKNIEDIGKSSLREMAKLPVRMNREKNELMKARASSFHGAFIETLGNCL